MSNIKPLIKKISIEGKDYELYFGIGFLELLDSSYGIDPSSLSDEFSFEEREQMIMETMGLTTLANTGALIAIAQLETHNRAVAKKVIQYALAEEVEQPTSRELDTYIFKETATQEDSEAFFGGLVDMLGALPGVDSLLGESQQLTQVRQPEK